MRLESADFYRPVIRRADAVQVLLRQSLASREKEYAPVLRQIAREHAAPMERFKRHVEQSQQAQYEARVASRRLLSNHCGTRIVRQKAANFFGAHVEKSAKVRKIEVKSLPHKQLPLARSFARCAYFVSSPTLVLCHS